MALSQDCLDDAMDPSHGAEDSQDRVLGQCVWHAGWPGSGVHMCVCLCLFNRITCRFSSLTIWFIILYVYLCLSYLYIYIIVFKCVAQQSVCQISFIPAAGCMAA